MPKIWPCYEGKIVTAGDPWKEISLAECEHLLDLHPSDYRWSLSETVRFGNPHEDQTCLGYRHVVAEVSDSEASSGGGAWRPGRYVVRMTPDEVYNRLGLTSTSSSTAQPL
jgi:hypothetical protein